MATLVAGLWTRPSTGTLARPPEANLIHLRDALGRLRARIASLGLQSQAGMKGILVAPEYYFARPQMGTWSNTGNRFEGRPIEQGEKEALVMQLVKISEQFPDIAFVPGSIAWRKPLDRSPREAFRRNPVTGLRTGARKSQDRRVKNVARLGAATELTGGQRMAARPLLEAIQDCIDTDNGGLGTAFDDRVAAGESDADAFWGVVNEVLYDATLRGQVILAYGLPPNCHTRIPTLAKKQADAGGAATHMMRNTAYLLYGGRIRFKYNKVGDFHESIGDGSTVFVPGDKLGLTEPIEGFSFGMEVCLDHNLGVFSSGFPAGKREPQIHIVISDSVENDPTHMKGRNYYLHASTDAAQTSCWGMKPAPASLGTLGAGDAVDGGTIDYWRLSV